MRRRPSVEGKKGAGPRRTRMELGEDDRGLSNVSCPVSVTKFLQPK